jgi:hypothetical protein
VAGKSIASPPRVKKARKAKPPARRLDRKAAETLSASLNPAPRRKNEDMVRALFQTFEKLKTHRVQEFAAREVFSSQDAGRANPPAKTPSQMAYDRISALDRKALLSAFSQTRSWSEPS